jgi:hypothetical protein
MPLDNSSAFNKALDEGANEYDGDGVAPSSGKSRAISALSIRRGGSF